MKRGRGVLALLFLFFLLLPPAHQSANGQVVSGAVLLSRVLVWGSKVIRVSLPFSTARLKSIYQSWKSAGKPAFSKLKLPLSTAVLYIGGSYLLSEFQRIASLEEQSQVQGISVVNAPAPVAEICSVDLSVTFDSSFCPCNYPSGCTDPNLIDSMIYDWASSTASYTRGSDSAPPCGYYRSWATGTIKFVLQDGSFRTWYLSVGVTDSFAQSLASLPPCGSGAGSFDLDTELSRILPNLQAVPVEAYPVADDPGYTDAFPIPAEVGDSISIEDTQTGQSTSETVSQDQQGNTQSQTDEGQMSLPDDNQYDPTIDIPQKRDIPGLIDTFINSSPLMRWIQGANISATAGTCSVSGTFLNKSFVLDFCPLAPYLNQIGAFILAFAHIYALYIIFRIR